MANKPGINNLFNIFEGINAFGAGPDARTKSLLDAEFITPETVKAANRRSIGTGIVTGLANYLAMPKNKGYGSAVPYLAQSYLQANKAAQAPFQGVADKYLMDEKLKDTKRNQTLRDELLKDPSIANDPLKRAAAIQNPVETFKASQTQAKAVPYNIQELNSEIAALKQNPKFADLTDVEIRNQAFKNIKLRELPPVPKIESAYDSELGKGLAQDDKEFVKQSQRLPSQIMKMDETVSIIRNPKTNVGAFADMQTKIDAVKQKFLNVNGGLKESVSATQLLDTLLGSEVFPMIKALGIGARGLDTPAEREFLRQVMTGTIGLNRDTLTKMTMIRRRQFAKMAKDYNQQLKSGGLDRVKKIRKLLPVDIPTGQNTPRIAEGYDEKLKRKFNIYADGSSFYLSQDGKVTDSKVTGFNWLDYNYDY